MQLRLLLGLVALLHSLPASRPMSTCKTIDMEQIRKKRIEAIRGQILSKLKLSSTPRAEQVTATKEAMDLYNSTKELLADLGRQQQEAVFETTADYYAKEVHRFAAQRPIDGPTFKIYTFNISLNLSSPADLHRAEFRLYREQKFDAPVEQQRVELYQIRSNRSIYMDNRLLRTKAADERISFDVTETVKEWILNKVGEQQLKITVHCPCDGNVLDERKTLQLKFFGKSRGDMGPLSEKSPKWPHILIMSTPSARAAMHSRRKRDISEGSCLAQSSEEQACCVQPMYIDFRHDLGWKWIHEPKGYYANFCMGPCPYIWSTDTQHAVVLGLYNMHNPGASASPCCVPQLLEPLTILYYVGRQAKVEQLSNMVVKACKCS